jgi:MtrB/PioB family decaheme-associated outer membrane protein
MKSTKNSILGPISLGVATLALLALPAGAWAQEDAEKDDQDKAADKQEVELSPYADEVSVGLYFLSDDAYRYGKYSGLTDDGLEPLLDFRLEKRPDWESSDTVRWRLQGWRLGLDSRRLEFAYNEQGTQKFGFDYREIPNNRFNDGRTPYRSTNPGLWELAPDWYVAPGTSNTLGFFNLQESLVDLRVDTERRRMDLGYERKLGSAWTFDVDFRHETKEGTRTLGSIFGHSAANPRGAILAAPVDWTTDIVEAMFAYSTSRIQFGVGAYASFFSNDESSFTFQNAYGYRNGWAPGVEYPDAYGRIALEPDNSYLQFKTYGGINLTPATRLTADFSYGKMEQDETLLPYTVNPGLAVHTPLPLDSLDAEVNTTMLNLRLTSQLARALGLAVNYRYDDRDNKTPRAVWPYIGADSQNQRAYEDGRLNLPYSYTRQRADATMTYRLARATRLKAGVEYSDYSRDYQEVSESDELTWLAGISMRGWSSGSLSLDLRMSDRDVDAYTGNAPLLYSWLPGQVGADEYENHPLLRKYYLADRDREEARFRADFAPGPVVNLGFSASYAEDDYDDSYFGLTQSEVRAMTVDAGWYPQQHISLTGFYTKEKYEAAQAARSFFNDASANDPANDWFADTTDKVDTWNFALNFTDVGQDRGWGGLDFGFDYTVSDTRSDIVVAAAHRRRRRRRAARRDRPGAEADPKLRIALISKVYPDAQPHLRGRGRRRRRHQSDDSLEHHFNDTVGGGDWLCDQDAVDYFVARPPRSWSSSSTGAARGAARPTARSRCGPFGGMKKQRTWYAADKSGFHILHTLFQTSLQFPRSSASTSTTHRPAGGRRALQRAGGDRDAQRQMRRFQAGAVIIAPAAPGACSRSPPTARSRPATAWRWPIAPACRSRTWSSSSTTRPACPAPASCSPKPAAARAASWSTRTATALLQDYGMGPETPVGQPVLKTMELGPRDRLSQAFWHEQKKGNMVPTRGATACCSTCATWARRRSTSGCRWCATGHQLSGRRPGERPRAGAPGGALHDGRHRHRHHAATRCPACSRPANAPASASTAPTGSARTR